MFYKMFSLIENSYVAYTAIVLDPESSQILLDKFRDLIPEGWKKYAHHMTINMKTASDGPANGLLGFKPTMKVVGSWYRWRSLEFHWKRNVSIRVLVQGRVACGGWEPRRLVR